MSTRTVFTALEEAAAKYGDKTALIQPMGGGKTETYSWNQYMQIVKEVTCGLRSLGIQRGDVVAILFCGYGDHLEWFDGSGHVYELPAG
jgi:acyl-CoA synthetase (AMP-forming)/AMP-acid ligase II